MADSFTISPSEALLLGLCLEEYSLYDAEQPFQPRRTFLNVLTARLMPHVNTFRQTRFTRTTQDNCPDDIEWSGAIGRSPSHKDRILVSGEDSITVLTFDFSRRSLLDHIVAALWEVLCKTNYDRCVLGPNGSESAEGWFAFLKAMKAPEPLFERNGADSKTHITQFIEHLVEINECGQAFATGRQFGAVAYAIDEFEAYVWSFEEKREQYFELMRSELWAEETLRINEKAEEDAEEEFHDWLTTRLPSLLSEKPEDVTDEQWAKDVTAALETARTEIFTRYAEQAAEETLQAEPPSAHELGLEFRPIKRAVLREATKSLIASDLVNRCMHARALIDNLSQIEDRLVFDLTDANDVDMAQRFTISHVADARMALWLAFGEIMGVLRDADVEMQKSDAASGVSRAFKLQPADTPDRVMDRLLGVEAELNSRTDLAPEEVIERLSPVIEALAKRVWPQDFMPSAGFRGQKGDFAAILLNRLADNGKNSTFDRRFASIALALCKQYRNPALHSLDTFKCSFEEARFFLAGVRALVEIWKNWPPKPTEPKRIA